MPSVRMTRSNVGRWVLVGLSSAVACAALHAQDGPLRIPRPDATQSPACPVTRVLDDCRIGVRIDQEEHEIVLSGVLTPESQPARERLHHFLENLLEAEAVFLRYAPAAENDSDDPRIAHIFRVPDGLFVNLEVVRQGYAKVQTKPAGEHLDLLRYYERRASKSHKGIWAPPPPTRSAEASAEPAAKVAQDPDEIIVYVTKSGKKYHRKDCYHLRKSARPIPLKEAIRKGYEPCKHCDPPTLEDP